MNTPYKNSTNLQGTANQNNQSAALYPSMESGFIPFEESTPKNTKFQNHNRNNTPYNNVPYFSGGRQNHRGGGGNGRGNWSQNRNQYRQNNHRNNSYYGVADGEDASCRDNRDNPGFFNRPQNYQNASGGMGKNRFNNFQQNRRSNFNQHQHRGGKKLGYGGAQNRNASKHVDISEYVHPSMMEDPWKDLLERHVALKSANLNIFTDKEENEQTAAASSSNSDENANSNDEDENRASDNSDD